MKTIKQDELFRNLGDFLKSKGIELNDGSYTARIQRGCNLLADAINATQKTVKQTKDQVDLALDQLRQTIHQRTAPKPSPQTKSSSKTKSTGKGPTKAGAQRKKGSSKV
jgi:hypothetical protein